MCGIAGLFDTVDRRPVDRDLLVRMNNRLTHRGPDEQGVHIEPGVGLGHRRLSIIDLSTGQQPLFNEDGSVAVVYNGEIYNFIELTKELKRCGHQFRTHSDTEVIVHAWEEWGEQCIARFRGMFAFAIWDRNRETLFLARDRLGIKPLYYCQLPDGVLLFGSELKALMEHPSLPRQIDCQAIEEYFAFGYVPEPKTIYSDVLKLEPGHSLLAKRGSPMPRSVRYWDVPFDRARNLDARNLEVELIDRFREAVRIRLISEVPLGAFLSGGVDSSGVVAMMAAEAGSEPVNTCSIGFDVPSFNETEFAQKVAERYRTRHYVETVASDDFDLIDRLAELYDEPYADSSAIPTYRVCQLARKRVTVALSGDGGDENFAGYRRYKWHMNEERVRRLVPDWFRGPLFGMLGRWYPKLDWAPKIFRAKTTFEALARNSLSAYLHSVSFVGDDLRSKVFSDGLKQSLQGYHAMEVYRRHAAMAPVEDALSLVQYLDMKTYLPGDILTKVDRASMAHALEVRVPLLDHEFVEWISSLPPELKLKGAEGKWLFKKALEPHVPSDVLYRRKMGFAVPLARWFKGPLRQQVRERLLGDEFGDSGYFNMSCVRRILDQHQSGTWDHSTTIWTLLMFDSFQRHAGAESNRAVDSSPSLGFDPTLTRAD